MKIKENINNKEDMDCLLEQLLALQKKSPTATNLKISVENERIEDKEEEPPSQQFDIETSSFPLEGSEPSEPERENTERIENNLPQPESYTFNLLKSLIPLDEKPSKSRKCKKVQQSIEIKENINTKEDMDCLLEQLLALQKKSPTATNLKISVHYEKIEDKEEEPPSEQFDIETSSFPLQGSEPSEPERRETSEETEMIMAPCKEVHPKPGSEASLPANALSFLEQLKSSFKKPSGNRKQKQVLRTVMFEDIVSDDEDTAQYSELVLQQLKVLCNESPTAHDPRVTVQILHLDPTEDICADKGDELPLQIAPESTPLLEQPAEPKSEMQSVHLERVEDTNVEMEDHAKLFYYLLSCAVTVPTYFSALAGYSEPERTVQPELTESTSVEHLSEQK
ncbi:uncharacterized protein LOC116411989 [Xenopus tropicalis]|uniref:Uncharacterized protein LOC116411989 n=1 Tax=Xenopus tropicalis TaxID=8364 RepID=A0A8J1JRW2_XENTR|nr:uncharacterized protein LOC116411989 [Xenopus tropicalis]